MSEQPTYVFSVNQISAYMDLWYPGSKYDLKEVGFWTAYGDFRSDEDIYREMANEADFVRMGTMPVQPWMRVDQISGEVHT